MILSKDLKENGRKDKNKGKSDDSQNNEKV